MGGSGGRTSPRVVILAGRPGPQNRGFYERGRPRSGPRAGSGPGGRFWADAAHKTPDFLISQKSQNFFKILGILKIRGWRFFKSGPKLIRSAVTVHPLGAPKWLFLATGGPPNRASVNGVFENNSLETPNEAAVSGPFSGWLFGAQRPFLHLGSAKPGHFQKNVAPGVGRIV